MLSSSEFSEKYKIDETCLGNTKVIESETNLVYTMKSISSIYHEMIPEISALMSLRTARNIINIKNFVWVHGFKNPYIILVPSNASKPSNPSQLKSMMFDILNGMLSLYNKNIYYLNLKLQNILYNTHLKQYVISDLINCTKMTENNIINYNQSPEILLSSICDHPYIMDHTSNLWSIGLIMAQISCNMNYIENPIHEEYIKIEDKSDTEYALLLVIYNIFGKKTINRSLENCPTINFIDLPRDPIIPLRTRFSHMNDQEYAFMTSLTKLNHRDRPSFKDIFSHTYFTGFHPSERIDMSPLDRVRSMDYIIIRPLHSMSQGRMAIIKWLINTINKKIYKCQESYFLAVMIFDLYSTKIIDTESLSLVAIASLILSSYVNNTNRQLQISHFTSTEPDFTTRIQAMILDMLNILDYNLYFSTEREYLDAYLTKVRDRERPTLRKVILSQLMLISTNPHFRDYSKEIIVSSLITSHQQTQIPDPDREMLNILGIEC